MNWKVIAVVVVAIVFLMAGGLVGALVLAGGGGGAGGTPTDGPNVVDDPPPTPLPNTATATATPAVGTSTATASPSPTPTSTATASPSPTATLTATATPTVAPTPTPTATPTPTPTATPTPTGTRTAIPRSQFDEVTLEFAFRRILNDWRSDEGLGELRLPNGTVSERLNRMALNHSEAMDEAGRTLIRSYGRTVADRYREYDNYVTCRFVRDDSYIVNPNRNFEVRGTTYIGQNYEGDSGTEFNEDEQAAARTLFQNLLDNGLYEDRLRTPEFNRVGVGVLITDDNEVWLTVDFCKI